MNDQELAAEARRVAAELSRRPRDLELIRYAAVLLREQADRLDGAQATEGNDG